MARLNSSRAPDCVGSVMSMAPSRRCWHRPAWERALSIADGADGLADGGKLARKPIADRVRGIGGDAPDLRRLALRIAGSVRAAGLLELAREGGQVRGAEIAGHAREAMRLRGKARPVPRRRQAGDPLDALGRVADPGVEELRQRRRRDDPREVLEPLPVDELGRGLAGDDGNIRRAVPLARPARDDLAE